MELIFILTYNCNFRCTYCDIYKRDEEMSETILNDSLSFLNSLTGDYNIDKVKFFGGEPILKKQYIKKIVSEFPSKFSPNFYVTTNSTLIDRDFINFSKEKGLKVTFSIDGDASTTGENRLLVGGGNLGNQIIGNTKKYADNIRINQVITSKNSHNFFNNFKFIYNLGVREFNFLPEYYRKWTKEGLKNLINGFNEIKNFYNAGNDFYLVNKENYSETAFFNLGIVIDTDGSIYGTNLILSGDFEKNKPELKVGDIYSGIRSDFLDKDFSKSYTNKVNSLLIKEYNKEILLSVKYVDKILNNFVINFSGK